MYLFPEFDNIRNQMIAIQIKMLMPEVVEHYGGFTNLNIMLNTPWIDYEGIAEEPVKNLGFIKITKKGIKSLITMPLQILLEEKS